MTALSTLGQAVLGFLGTASAGVLSNVPRRALPWCGLVGTAGWLLAAALVRAGVSPIAANFAAALLVALCSEALARVLKLPAPCLSVPGVIPLVPGLTAYRAMSAFVQDQSAKGDALAVQALLIAAAISAGMVLAGALFRTRGMTRHSMRAQDADYLVTPRV